MRFEAREEVRIVRLRTPQRPFDGSDGALRAPRIGDVGQVLQTATTSDLNATVLVACIAADGATIWRAEFVVDELAPTEDTLQRRRQRTVRRSRRWLAVALALAGGSTCFAFLLGTIEAYLLTWSTWIVALALLVASLSDLGRAHGSQPGATSLDQEVGFFLQAPRILVALAGVASGSLILHQLVTSKFGRMNLTPFVAVLAVGLALLAGGAHLLWRRRRTR